MPNSPCELTSVQTDDPWVAGDRASADHGERQPAADGQFSTSCDSPSSSQSHDSRNTQPHGRVFPPSRSDDLRPRVSDSIRPQEGESASGAGSVRGSAAILAACGVCFCLAGLFVRVTIRDNIPYLAAFYYMTPWVLLCWGFAGCTLLAGLARRRVVWFLALAGMFACLPGVFADYRHVTTSEPHANGGRATQVIFWNTARGRAGWQAVSQRLNSYDADVFALVESGDHHAELRRFWKNSFADYQVVFLGHGMLLASRNPIHHVMRGRLGDGGYFGRVDTWLDNEPVTIFVVDVHSHPLLYRREPLRELAKLVQAVEDRRVIVMGDFNTPADSVHLEALREQLANGFETIGSGTAATWPTPLPVLALDQFWYTPTLTAERLRHDAWPESDHELLAIDFNRAAAMTKPTAGESIASKRLAKNLTE